MTLSVRGAMALAVAVCATVLAGCSGDPVSAPPAALSDPAGLSNDVQSLDAPFGAAVLQSFSAVGGATPLNARTTSFLAAMAPTRPALTLRATGTTRKQVFAVRALRPAFSTAAPAGPGSLIPDSLWGRVYVWDTSTGDYVEGATTGGPATGVRFTLYAINPLTNVPAEPLNAIGYADLSDESSTSQYKLGVLVADPSNTYADYLITATATASSFTAFAVGYVTDGTHRLDFNNTASATSTKVAIDLALALNQPAVSARLQAVVEVGNPTSVLTLSFNVTRGTEIVVLSGTLAATVDQSSSSATANLTITVNTSRFATITGTIQSGSATGYTYNGPDRALTASEREAVDQLLTAPSTIVAATDPVYAPAEDLIGSSYSLGL
jgi:hypothetical protein